VVSIAVRENDGGDRLGCDLGDIVEQFLPARGSRLGVDDDDAIVADDDAAISAAALHPVNVGLQLMSHEWRGRLAGALTLRHGRNDQHGQSSQHGKTLLTHMR